MPAMATRGIEIPLGVREFMPHWVHETVLGSARGASRQYRYGNLHIRMYDDRYEVHVDRADPRRDAARHLLYDAPGVLACMLLAPAAACALHCATRWPWGKKC